MKMDNKERFLEIFNSKSVLQIKRKSSISLLEKRESNCEKFIILFWKQTFKQIPSALIIQSTKEKTFFTNEFISKFSE